MDQLNVLEGSNNYLRKGDMFSCNLCFPGEDGSPGLGAG